MHFIVYKITNIINGKIYIGQTSKDIVTRFKQHCTKASKVPYLRNAIQKYGKHNFRIEQLGTTDIESEVDQLEQHYISIYKSTNHEFGYNISTGGDHGILGLKRSNETKAKMRAKRVGKTPMKGKLHNDTSKLKMSNSRRGKIPWNKGISTSDDVKFKISLSLKNRLPCIKKLSWYDRQAIKFYSNNFEMTGVDLAKLYCVSKWLVYSVLKENNCDY